MDLNDDGIVFFNCFQPSCQPLRAMGAMKTLSPFHQAPRGQQACRCLFCRTNYRYNFTRLFAVSVT